MHFFAAAGENHVLLAPLDQLAGIADAVRAVFADKLPLFSSTKSLTGHALGAAGVNEAIYSLLMLEHDFACASANIETLDPAAEGMPVVRQRVDHAGLNTVMSNSFGFGGTNACLVFRRLTS